MAAVPRTYGQFVQQCGRTKRMNSHDGLPEEEQEVSFKIYLATTAVCKTEDELAFAKLCRGAKTTEAALREFRANASSTNPAVESLASVFHRLSANQIRARENTSKEKIVAEVVLPQNPTMTGEDGTDMTPISDHSRPSPVWRDETTAPARAKKARIAKPKKSQIISRASELHFR